MVKSSLEVARHLRREATVPERLVWNAVRRDRLGVSVRRQHRLGRFIVDFWCDAAALVIEIDGAHHEEATRRSADAARTAELERNDVLVIRFTNRDVLEDLPAVIARIREVIARRRRR